MRLLGLEVCAELFARSRLFRSLLASKFTIFLERILGFRIQTPLPGPPAAAQRLRTRALELLERWNAEQGTRHPQIALGYAYVRGSLGFEFPEVDARGAAQEAAHRQRE